MGQFVHIYTLSSGYRPCGITAIVAGWDTSDEATVDGEVGSGPGKGAGGKQEGLKVGGPFLYMIEPSGSYWVCLLKIYSTLDILIGLNLLI
jgi:20S proteasome subunit alpha 7